MPLINQSWIFALEFFATTAFAVSGVLGAMRKQLDIVGVCVCAFLAAFGGGLFCATGTHLSSTLDQPPIVAVMMGVITGTFGGVLRDLVRNQIPELFSDHRPYAICAAAGAASYSLAMYLDAPSWLAMSLCAVLTIGLRTLALQLDFTLPPVGRP